MITAEPKNWKDLQIKVNYILSCVGLVSEIEKSINTPRGSVAIDVFAYDPNSLDKIRYIIECKNWNKKVPQNVIHSFTTVMQETGANIGYIISKKGFQNGAKEYINYTNIRLFSYDEFQNHYFENWYDIYFANEIFKSNSLLNQFTEPINFKRFKYEEGLNGKQKLDFKNLLNKYSLFSYLILNLSSSSIDNFNVFHKNKPISLKQLEIALSKCFEKEFEFNNYIEALATLKDLIKSAEKDFIDFFWCKYF